MASDVDTERYFELLRRIRDHLASVEDPRWPQVLDDWLNDVGVRSGSGQEIKSHLQRTRSALFGMGSLADIFISPESGHALESDDETVRAANEQLLSLVRDLDAEVSRLMHVG